MLWHQTRMSTLPITLFNCGEPDNQENIFFCESFRPNLFNSYPLNSYIFRWLDANLFFSKSQRRLLYSSGTTLEDPIIWLGVPLSPSALTFLTEKTTLRAISLTKSCAHLSSQAFLILLKSCVISRFTFLLCHSNFYDTSPLVSFDEQIRNITLQKFSLSQQLHPLFLYLPTQFKGMGISSSVELAIRLFVRWFHLQFWRAYQLMSLNIDIRFLTYLQEYYNNTSFLSTILPTPSFPILLNFNILCIIFGLRTPQMHFLLCKEPPIYNIFCIKTSHRLSDEAFNFSLLIKTGLIPDVTFNQILNITICPSPFTPGHLYFAKAPNLSDNAIRIHNEVSLLFSKLLSRIGGISSTGERSVFTMKNKSLNLISLSPPPFYLLPVSSFWMFQLLILFPLPLVTLHFLALSPSYENLPKLEGTKLFWNKILDPSSFHFASLFPKAIEFLTKILKHFFGQLQLILVQVELFEIHFFHPREIKKIKNRVKKRERKLKKLSFLIFLLIAIFY